jgi:hypothetical protein
MPDEDSHLQQAHRNEQCYQALTSINPSRFADWEVTTLFYSALHYTEALCARYGSDYPHPTSHSERKKELANQVDLDTFDNYCSLHDHSEEARYNTIPFSEDEVAYLHEDYYLPIRDTVMQLLGV